MEREYNHFFVEPAYFSHGNGSYRDVNQNRRNDIYFVPEAARFNIRQFMDLIQMDGHNPLTIKGSRLVIQKEDIDDILKYVLSNQKIVKDVISKPFTPGELMTKIDHLYVDLTVSKDVFLDIVSSHSVQQIESVYGTGYWSDHFIYNMDLIDAYLNVFPDQLDELFFKGKYRFYQSHVSVYPRKVKYVLTPSNEVKQLGALYNDDEKVKETKLKVEQTNFHQTSDFKEVEVDFFTKMIHLVTIKFSSLDPYFIGIMMDSEKPGWNDAMNGLPGLFGSGVSEMIELTKLVDFILEKLTQYKDHEIKILASTFELGLALSKVKGETPYDRFNERMSVLEKYRDQLDQEQSTISIKFYELEELLKKMKSTLEESIKRAKEINPVIPTYLIFEAKDYVELKDEHGNPIIGEYGLPTVSVQSFEMRALPNFLEAPARYLKNHASEDEANHLHHLIKNSELYDQNLHFYKTSVSIEEENHEIGRIRAFTKGWFERESNFLHMTYKYLLGLLKAGLYDTFYEEIKTNLTAFMDPLVYGRSPYENSSFIAPSNNPDPKKRGQGFVSRLTGSTAEVLSMWKLMFFGPHMFYLDHGQLSFKLEPKLHKSLFKNGQIEVTLFEKTKVVYFNPTGLDTYDPACKIEKMVLFKGDEECEITSDRIIGKWTRDIRDGYVDQINVYIQGGK